MATRREEEKKKARRTSAKAWAEEKDRSFSPTCIKLPQGMEFFKLTKVGEIEVDFMPFIAGKFNRYADEGIDHYHAYYDCHRIPTENGSWPYTCRRFFKERCAACDWRTKYGMQDAFKKVADEMKAKTRILWLVNDKPGDAKNPLKVFDTNEWNNGKGFGEQMKKVVAKICRRDDIEDPFTLKGGYTAEMVVEQQSGFTGGKPYNAVVRIDLVKRKYDYPKSMLSEAPCLDAMIVDPGYEEVMELLMGGVTESREEETPKGRSTSKGVDLEEDEEDEKDRKPSRKPSPKDEDEEDEKDELDEDEEDKPKPTKPSKTPAKKSPPKDEDEEDEWDSDLEDDEEEEPKPKKRK